MPATANRFDFIRLLLATSVFVYHTVTLAALNVGGPWESGLAIAAELSIQGFFIVSGALVFGSLERSKSIADYAGKRVRRLYPAYAVILLIPALIALFLTGALSEVGRYLGANLVFLNFLAPDLPSLFAGNRFTEVNGALWTLKIEVMFYLALPVFWWVMRATGRRWPVLIALYIGGEAWRYYFASGAAGMPAQLTPYLDQISRQLPGQMAYFASGMALWLLWDRAKAAPLWLLPLGAGIAAASFLVPYCGGLRAIGLACLIAWTAFSSGPALNAARWGDVSYGVYIVHFPVVQALVALGIFAIHPALGFAAAAILVFGLSFLLWHLVERPALREGSHYRKAADTG